ncbi:MAG: hypothetical protein R3F56_22595 [Planctomycetota bacterium]
MRSPRPLAVLLVAVMLCACTSVRARAYAGITQTTLQGDMALDNAAGNLNLGTNRVDVGDEAGLDDRELSPYLRAELGLPIGGVTISGFDYSQTGSGTLAANHQFGDIPGGNPVTSHLSFTNVKAAAHFDLLNLGVVRVSPGLGVDFVDFDIEVADATTLGFERVDNEVFVPMVFVQAEANAGIVAATLDVGYMQASLHDARGQFLDVEALVRVNPLPLFEIFAGYRLISLDARGVADERRYDADLRLHGWMLGGGITF